MTNSTLKQKSRSDDQSKRQMTLKRDNYLSQSAKECNTELHYESSTYDAKVQVKNELVVLGVMLSTGVALFAVYGALLLVFLGVNHG